MSNYNRNLYEHERSDCFKWVVSFLLIAVLIVWFVFSALDWWTDYGPRTWVKQPDEQQTEQEDNGGGLEVTPDEPSKEEEKDKGDGGEDGGEAEEEDTGSPASISFTVIDIPRSEYAAYGIMPIAENAQQVTAVITPVEAEDKVLDWSVAFKNPSSTWASGKTVTDYVTVTPTSDGALTANVSCLQAFGEQVTITAAIRGHASVKGTATADYKQGYSGITANIAYTNTTADANLTWAFGTSVDVKYKFPGYAKSYTEFTNYYSATGSNKGTYNVTVTTALTTVYTVAATVTDVKIEVKPALAYISAVQNAKGTISQTQNTWTAIGTGTGANATISGFDFTKLIMASGSTFDWVAFKRDLKTLSPSTRYMSVQFTTTVNGKAQTKGYDIYFDADSFGTFASGVNLGPNLVFGG